MCCCTPSDNPEFRREAKPRADYSGNQPNPPAISLGGSHKKENNRMLQAWEPSHHCEERAGPQALGPPFQRGCEMATCHTGHKIHTSGTYLRAGCRSACRAVSCPASVACQPRRGARLLLTGRTSFHVLLILAVRGFKGEPGRLSRQGLDT